MLRFLITALCGATLAWAQAGGDTTLTGKVVDATTKEGIRKATVLAVRNSMDNRARPGNFSMPEQFSVKTDDGGAFRLTGLPAGSYALSAERQGYLAAGGMLRQSVNAKAGQELAVPELQLVRQGVIMGRVVDAEGDPVEFVSIQALPAGGGTSAMNFAGGVSATTDDRGEFRLSRLRPGSYRVLAVSGRGRTGVQLAQGAEPPMMDAPTYFPSSLDEAAASKIPVGSGEERTGVEIRLQRTNVVRVSGKVDGDMPRDVPVSVSLQRLAARSGARNGVRMGQFGPPNSGLTNAEGNFTIANVMPGEYVVTANSHSRGLTQTGYTKIRVGQQDLDGVQVHLQPPGRIAGRISGAGGGKAPTQPFHIGLRAAESGMPGGGGAMVKPDGTFVMENIVRTRMTLLPTAPDGWFLQSVLVGSQPVPGKEFDMVGPETRLELIFSDKPGSVEGNVSNGEGVTTVLLLPAGEEGAPPDGQWFKNGMTKGDQNTFQIKSVAPGTYYAIACPPEAVSLISDPAVWARIKDKAARVTVEEQKAATVSLRAVAAEDLEEK